MGNTIGKKDAFGTVEASLANYVKAFFITLSKITKDAKKGKLTGEKYSYCYGEVEIDNVNYQIQIVLEPNEEKMIKACKVVKAKGDGKKDESKL